jgi:hypothetical protein
MLADEGLSGGADTKSIVEEEAPIQCHHSSLARSGLGGRRHEILRSGLGLPLFIPARL